MALSVFNDDRAWVRAAQTVSEIAPSSSSSSSSSASVVPSYDVINMRPFVCVPCCPCVCVSVCHVKMGTCVVATWQGSAINTR